MEVSLDPGHRGLQFPILGYEESSAQLALTRSTMPCFPPSQLHDPELSKEEYKGEQAGAECWAPQGETPSAGLGPGPKAALRPPIWWTAICQHI